MWNVESYWLEPECHRRGRFTLNLLLVNAWQRDGDFSNPVFILFHFSEFCVLRFKRMFAKAPEHLTLHIQPQSCKQPCVYWCGCTSESCYDELSLLFSLSLSLSNSIIPYVFLHFGNHRAVQLEMTVGVESSGKSKGRLRLECVTTYNVGCGGGAACGP